MCVVNPRRVWPALVFWTDEMRHGCFSLMGCLDEIEDPRGTSNGTFYDFREMLVIAICSSLCDMEYCETFPCGPSASALAEEVSDAKKQHSVFGDFLLLVSGT